MSRAVRVVTLRRMRCHQLRSVLLAGLLAISPAAAVAGKPLPLAEPGSAAWQPLHFPSIEKHTHYEALASPELDGRSAWRASATCSSSAMVLPMLGVDLERTPRLSWRWRVETPLVNPDEQSKAGR